jgi:ubiquinone biosynthesis protein
MILRPMQWVRIFRIFYVVLRHTMNRRVLAGQSAWLLAFSYLNPLSYLKQGRSRGDCLRFALESLGPIFVKFGQVLSTRPDLLADDIIAELSKLQDQVPAFDSQKAIVMIEAALQQPLSQVFKQFDKQPLASASVAQVYSAILKDGDAVVVKVLRPNIKKVIRHDIALLYFVARLISLLWSYGRYLRPVELVTEFDHTIHHELDLVREAASASQLRRNFIDSDIMYVPKVYWPYTRHNVMVMERIYGTPISNIAELKATKVNMKKLAEHGVTIFFTQVFRDGFFHADMHPGNLFVDVSDPDSPSYLGVDFGIMGTLSPEDQYYLAENILAFFHRDYRRIAVLHIESGWVSPDTRVDQLESAVRTVSEPIFEKPLRDISFGQLLLRLFQTAKQFHMTVQPQLMLLQKTLFNIEGLGRSLYPDLDLWETAKPFMENWGSQQKGLKKMVKTVAKEWETSFEGMLKAPKLVYDVLHHIHGHQQQAAHHQGISPSSKKSSLGFLTGVGSTLLVVGGYGLVAHRSIIWLHVPWQWLAVGAGAVLLLGGVLLHKKPS